MAIKFVIETNIPVPTYTGRGRSPKYPWHEMRAGDSFSAGAYDRKVAAKLTNAASGQSRRHGGKFTCRRDGDVVRVWRVA